MGNKKAFGACKFLQGPAYRGDKEGEMQKITRFEYPGVLYIGNPNLKRLFIIEKICSGLFGGGERVIFDKTLRHCGMFLDDVVYCCNYLHWLDQPKYLKKFCRRHHIGIPQEYRDALDQAIAAREKTLASPDYRGDEQEPVIAALVAFDKARGVTRRKEEGI